MTPRDSKGRFVSPRFATISNYYPQNHPLIIKLTSITSLAVEFEDGERIKINKKKLIKFIKENLV